MLGWEGHDVNPSYKSQHTTHTNFHHLVKITIFLLCHLLLFVSCALKHVWKPKADMEMSWLQLLLYPVFSEKGFLSEPTAHHYEQTSWPGTGIQLYASHSAEFTAHATMLSFHMDMSAEDMNSGPRPVQ